MNYILIKFFFTMIKLDLIFVKFNFILKKSFNFEKKKLFHLEKKYMEKARIEMISWDKFFSMGVH